jgi:VWFA-related protein
MPPSLRPRSGAVLGILLAASATGQEPPYVLPGVETSRVVLEARVTDGRGRPLVDLGRDDFRLEVDGRTTPVESVVWVAEAPSTARERPGGGPTATVPAAGTPSPGRLVVLLFQKDFEGSRLRGLLRAIRQAKGLVVPFSPRDRVAVLTYDSRLRLHLDFTSDFASVRRTLDESVLRRWPAPLEPGEAPSLAAHLDGAAARDAASPEEALLALGRALGPIPGTKTVLFFGYGLGDLQGDTVVLHRAYGDAVAALDRARAAVFCLDVTEADWHSLETGLQRVAKDTGGEYLKVHQNAGAALDRIAGALSGHYVLTFERPEGRRGEHRVRLTLARRRGSVLTRTRYVD